MLKLEHFALNLYFLSLSSSQLIIDDFFISAEGSGYTLSWLELQLGAKLTPPSSAVASHHHLPGKNWHPCKSPAVNPSADCSLTWFSQTHQVQLKHVNIRLSKAPTQCWSRPGSCQPQPFPPLSPYLPTGDQHVLGSACHFNCWVWGFFNTINFRVLGMQYSSRKKLVQNKNKGRRTTSGQRVEQASS